MPAELVENEGQRERDGPGADGRRGARLAGIRKGSPAVDRVREIPCPAPPRFARRSAHGRFGFADQAADQGVPWRATAEQRHGGRARYRSPDQGVPPWT